MIVDRHSALWSLIFFAAVAAQIVELPPIPEWLNNAIFLASFIIIIVAASMLGILQLHQRATNNQDVVIFGDKVSGHLARIVNYQYKILFVSAVVAFTAGAFIFPPKSNDLGKHMPVLEDGMLSPPSDPTSVVIPLTPARLFEIARTQTRRDAMSHKGSLIHFQGTVLDISEVKERWSEADASYKLVIGIEVAIGSLSHDRVAMFVEADRWKPQVNKIERGDWIVANGVVDHVTSSLIGLINGEIISVSRVDGNRK